MSTDLFSTGLNSGITISDSSSKDSDNTQTNCIYIQYIIWTAVENTCLNARFIIHIWSIFWICVYLIMKHSRGFDISVVKSINTASKIPIGLGVAILFVPCLNKTGNIKFFLLQLHLSKKSFLCTAKHAYSKVLVTNYFDLVKM